MADISIIESEGKEYNIKDEVARELIEAATAKKISGKYTWNSEKLNSNADLVYDSNWAQKVNFNADGTDYTEMSVRDNCELYYDNMWWMEKGAGTCGSPNDLDFGTEPQTVSEEFYNIIMTCTNEGTGGGENTEEVEFIKAQYEMEGLEDGLYAFRVPLGNHTDNLVYNTIVAYVDNSVSNGLFITFHTIAGSLCCISYYSNNGYQLRILNQASGEQSDIKSLITNNTYLAKIG